jgi:hypothetical protein
MNDKMKLYRFLTTQRETRIGLLNEENHILDLSDGGENNLTFLLEAENPLERIEALSQQSLARFSLNQIQVLCPVEQQKGANGGI